MNRNRVIGITLAAIVFVSLSVGVTYFTLRHSAIGQEVSVTNLASRKWAQEIGLTEDQQKRLAPLEQTLKKDLQKVQMQLANERMALCGILHGGSKDTQELDRYIGKIAGLEAQQQKLVVSHLVSMRDFLSPDQRDRFFNAVMKDICQSCRMATDRNMCLCGMCNLKKT